MIQQESNTTKTKTTGYTQDCANKLPCGICRLMQTACLLNAKSWDTTSKNPYYVTIVDYGKEAQ